MDHINIPPCALNRQLTTVIIRTNMDVSNNCCRSEVCPDSDCPKVVHRLSGCEKCNRTRLNNKYSDCDSGLIGKCRTYKSRAARSRYVNVCAVVCLLLLFGGLSPRSSAAPYRSRTMDRQKRASDEENSLWGNPCGYNQSNSKTVYTPKNARYVAQQAKYSYQQAVKYKDAFASKLHSVTSFDALISSWSEQDWLRSYEWYTDDVLPRDKVLYQPMPEDRMSELMGKIDEVLPSMYKGLKMIVAGLYVFTESLRNDNISTDTNLTGSISETISDIRNVLCYFYDLMVARNLEIHPLPDHEVPKITKGNQLMKGLLIYRDTLNYLEYLAQVFQKMAESDLSGNV